MKFLVIGLGSMGKRRVRNLQALGMEKIIGFDPRADRRAEAAEKYGIPVFESLDAAHAAQKTDALVISTPPALHMQYAFWALAQGMDCFIEASVVDAKGIEELAKQSSAAKRVMVPSCTMSFYPGPRKVKELVHAGAIGRILNINYQTGQYLPDWHPWEDIADFYVSARETGGAREIVPFELTWLCDVFGPSQALGCWKGKLSSLDADIDDLYHCLVRFPEHSAICQLTVEVISRPKATREMRILGSEGELVFSADSNSVRYISTGMEEWTHFHFDAGTIEQQYINPEEPYIEEMRCFVAAAQQRNPSLFPNTLEKDVAVLHTLYELERLSAAAKH